MSLSEIICPHLGLIVNILYNYIDGVSKSNICPHQLYRVQHRSRENKIKVIQSNYLECSLNDVHACVPDFSIGTIWNFMVLSDFGIGTILYFIVLFDIGIGIICFIFWLWLSLFLSYC